MLKNIVFDFGNVIINYNPDLILNQYDLTPEQHELLKKEIFQSKEWQDVDAGIIDEDEATQKFLERLPKDLHDKVKEIMTTWPEKVEFFNSVFDFMKELKTQGYCIYGLSNTGMRFAEYVKQSKWNDNFDGYIFSAQEKIMKPDKRIYQLLFNRYNLKPQECLFIDDLPKNVAAAKSSGMQGFIFNIKKLPELKEYIACQR